MKKVKLNYTDKGYSYIKCTKEDCFNWGGLAICDDCNEPIMEDVYLVFVLGRAYCKKCFEAWVQYSKRYEEDLYLQKQSHIAWYKAHGFEIEGE